MPIAPLSTQAFIPWPEVVAVTSTRRTGDVVVNVPNAGVYRQGTIEAIPARGVAAATKITVTLAQDAIPFTPKPADRVTWKGVDYTVQSVNGSDWLRFWSLDTLALALVNDLSQLGSLYRAANEDDGTGLRIPNPAPVAGALGVACRVQPQTGSSATRFDGLASTRSYRCYLGIPVYPQADDRWVLDDGTTFAVTGWGDAELIGRLPYLDLELLDGVPIP